MAEICVEHLQKAFGNFTAVRDSTFTVRNGQFFCLLGPSGCGKTTTLRMIAGLELPTAGCILLGGEDVTFKRASQRDIAFVFQLFALYPHMNVRTNIAYPLRSQGMLRHDVQTRVEEAARILRIQHLLDRSVSGLSSGDRQRVALGRAIVRYESTASTSRCRRSVRERTRNWCSAYGRSISNCPTMRRFAPKSSTPSTSARRRSSR